VRPCLLAAASAARSPSPSPSSSSSLISCRGWLDGAGNHVTAGGRSIGTHLIMNDLTCTMSVRWCAQSHASVRVGRSRTCRAPRSVCLSGKPRAQRGQGPSDSRPHGLQAVKLAGFVRPAMLLWGVHEQSSMPPCENLCSQNHSTRSDQAATATASWQTFLGDDARESRRRQGRLAGSRLGLGTDRVNPRAGRASKMMGLHLQIFYGPKIHRIEFGLDRPVKELGCRHARVDDQGSARGS